MASEAKRLVWSRRRWYGVSRAVERTCWINGNIRPIGRKKPL